MGAAEDRAAHQVTCVWAAVKAQVAPLRERVVELEGGLRDANVRTRDARDRVRQLEAAGSTNGELVTQLMASDQKNVALLAGTDCSKRHRVAFNPRNEGVRTMRQRNYLL